MAINKRRFLSLVLRFGLIVLFPLMAWKALIFLTGSNNPIIVVTNFEMIPTFFPGDLLILVGSDANVRVGEIVAFSVESYSRTVTIIHRVIKVHEKKDGYVKLLTKADYNNVNDRGLYSQGQLWLEKKDIIGRVYGYIPYVGIPIHMILKIPYAQYLFLGIYIFWFF